MSLMSRAAAAASGPVSTAVTGVNYYRRQLEVLRRLVAIIDALEPQFPLLPREERALGRLAGGDLPLVPSATDPPELRAYFESKRSLGNLFIRAHLAEAARGFRGIEETKPPEKREKRKRPTFFLDAYEEERERGAEGLKTVSQWWAVFGYWESYWEQDMEHAIRLASLAKPAACESACGSIPLAGGVLEDMDLDGDKEISRVEFADYIRRVVGG